MREIDMIELDSVGRRELLDKAAKRAFFFGVDDVAARLAEANLPYGLAKIMQYQNSCGVEPDVTFISSSDATITRNIDRWKAGFSYGGRLNWAGEFIPVDIQPNMCGVLVAGLPGRPDVEEFQKRCAGALNRTDTLDGVEITWDFGISNHFVNLYKVENPDETEGYEYLVMFHGSGKELRVANRFGPGLGLKNNPQLGDIVSTVDTSFGPLNVIEGREAKEYYDFCKRAGEFSNKRREFYLETIAPGAKVLFNELHQTLTSPNSMVIGAYSTQERLSWYPFTLRKELPAYLLKPRQTYRRDVIFSNGYGEIATDLGILDRIQNADIIAHGGGYNIDNVKSFGMKLKDNDTRRVYTMEPGSRAMDHLRGLEFSYRGHEVLELIKRLDCASVATELTPITSIILS